MTRNEWGELAVAITATWPNSRFDDANSLAYYRILGWYEQQAVGIALGRLASSEDRLPSIARITEMTRLVIRERAPRGIPEKTTGRITFRDWILAGTYEYLDGNGTPIPPSAAYKIAPAKQSAVTDAELAAADAVWAALR